MPLRFAVLRDPADWLIVNQFKGNVTTKAILDRESPHVHNNQYTALFMATDNGRAFFLHWLLFYSCIFLRNVWFYHTYISNTLKRTILTSIKCELFTYEQLLEIQMCTNPYLSLLKSRVVKSNLPTSVPSR